MTEVNEHDLTVSWETPDVDFTRFEVRCEADGDYSDDFGQVESDESSVYSLTCIELTSGAYYKVKVETFNDNESVLEPGIVTSTTSKILSSMFSQVDYIILSKNRVANSHCLPFLFLFYNKF